ncbi:hypothetical protein LB553_22785 [Mesorhizobium sp. CA8]|uniref:hypothetical protein n=1 Tax=Mesorhizobium sp. CA8 TaxID=2876637 RepID=UPI001CC9F1C8|nr:hypothetical protein [Mesorhizobium sp. CA8]MBZ9763684.1 hypothetical protein [Mesorhizobium sp. CA8]
MALQRLRIIGNARASGHGGGQDRRGKQSKNAIQSLPTRLLISDGANVSICSNVSTGAPIFVKTWREQRPDFRFWQDRRPSIRHAALNEDVAAHKMEPKYGSGVVALAGVCPRGEFFIHDKS